MDDYGDDPDPFEHIRGEQHWEHGLPVKLGEVADDVLDALESQGALGIEELQGTIGLDGPDVLYSYYIEFLRREFVEQENELLPEVEIVGGVTVDQPAAVEGGYIADWKTDLGRRRISATEQLEREVVQDVVGERWDYRNTRGFGRFDDTLERYARAVIGIFETLYEDPAYSWRELELHPTKVYGFDPIRRDRERLFEEALPALEHAGVRIDRDKYAFALADRDQTGEAKAGTVSNNA